MPSCSIIIPVHNHASLTRQCLDALIASPPVNVDTEVIVVDDASTDDTPTLLAAYGKGIHIIRMQITAGFAIACNAGAANAAGDYLVFLNNDTIPQPGWLDALIGCMLRHPKAGLIGSKMLFPNDTIQHAGVVIGQDRLPRHLYAGFPADHPAVNVTRRFQIVTAACALIRSELFHRVGEFDTAYINGGEDVDLCLRLGALGYEVYYCHESVLYHFESITRQEMASEDGGNERLYAERWLSRVRPDDLDYYVADGLVKILYQGFTYPIRVHVSPILGLGETDSPDDLSLAWLLERRAHQVFALQREVFALRARMAMRELHTDRPNSESKSDTLSDRDSGDAAIPNSDVST